MIDDNLRRKFLNFRKRKRFAQHSVCHQLLLLLPFSGEFTTLSSRLSSGRSRLHWNGLWRLAKVLCIVLPGALSFIVRQFQVDEFEEAEFAANENYTWSRCRTPNKKQRKKNTKIEKTNFKNEREKNRVALNVIRAHSVRQLKCHSVTCERFSSRCAANSLIFKLTARND